MIDLYTWSTPNGRKISILLEELALPYRVVPVDITAGAQFDPAFLAISPNNKIPAIVDHATGTRLMESAAIMIHLAEKTGQLLPSSGAARDSVLEWLIWQAAGFGPTLGQVHHFLFYKPGASTYAETRFHEEAMRLYRVLDHRLAGAEFVAGDYSIADIAIWPWVARFERQWIAPSDFPHVFHWYEAIATRPAVVRGYAVPTPEAIPTSVGRP